MVRLGFQNEGIQLLVLVCSSCMPPLACQTKSEATWQEVWCGRHSGARTFFTGNLMFFGSGLFQIYILFDHDGNRIRVALASGKLSTSRQWPFWTYTNPNAWTRVWDWSLGTKPLVPKKWTIDGLKRRRTIHRPAERLVDEWTNRATLWLRQNSCDGYKARENVHVQTCWNTERVLVFRKNHIIFLKFGSQRPKQEKFLALTKNVKKSTLSQQNNVFKNVLFKNSGDECLGVPQIRRSSVSGLENFTL